jgi:hypothetical protein
MILSKKKAMQAQPNLWYKRPLPRHEVSFKVLFQGLGVSFHQTAVVQ